jgi:hypothetical protein
VQGLKEGNLADSLSRMLGVYVGLKGEVMPENVKKWNVLKVDDCPESALFVFNTLQVHFQSQRNICGSGEVIAVINLLGQVEIPKDNRHRDRPIVQDIYAALDKFLAARQCILKY